MTLESLLKKTREADPQGEVIQDETDVKVMAVVATTYSNTADNQVVIDCKPKAIITDESTSGQKRMLSWLLLTTTTQWGCPFQWDTRLAVLGGTASWA